jgi:hypothetical protein
MDYWGGRCPLTGITEPALIRASHIVPWADCTDEQRLDVAQRPAALRAMGRGLRQRPRQCRRRWRAARKPPTNRDRALSPWPRQGRRYAAERPNERTWPRIACATGSRPVAPRPQR